MTEQALSIKGLHKTYKGAFEAVKGIDLDVKKGDFFALLGPNGAGKSTTIGIICSLINKTAGSVEIFGHDIDKAPSEAKRHIGLVPQEFNFNVWEPCIEILINQAGFYGIPRRVAVDRAESLLKELGLWEKRHIQARDLSGGMKRRLMIARSLIHKPELLILDEPTAGVDIELRRSMWDFLRRINADGTTIILTTHYLEEAESLCRHIAIIDEGNIVENTDIKSLLLKQLTQTFVLDLTRDIDKAPGLEGIDTKFIDSHTIEVTVSQEANLNELFQQLSGLGLSVASMRNKSNRLEELFVKLVNGDKDKRKIPINLPESDGVNQ